MKKNFIFNTLSVAAMTILAAGCHIDDPKAGPIVDPNANTGGGGGEEEQEYLIKVDGDFSDWNEIPSDKLVVSTVSDNAFFPTAKKVMVYAGATYINLYIEFHEQENQPVQIMHLYIDSDNDQTTGMGNPAWTNDGTDVLFEGMFVDDNGAAVKYDPTIFGYTGAPLAGEWKWDTTIAASGIGVCNNCDFVTLSNGNKAFEMTILRAAIPNLGKIFRMGIALQYDWNDIAYFPAGPAVEKNGTKENGPVKNLLIGATNSPSNAQLTIDGKFDDWDKLSAEDVWSVENDPDAFYPAAKKLRLAYNADMVFAYLEYDATVAGIIDLYLDTDNAFDAEGNATTGWGSWIWKNDGTDLLVQGEIGEKFDPEIFAYTGDAMAGAWNWTSIAAAGSGIVNSSASVALDNGNTALEMSIMRAGLPNLGNDLWFGLMLEKTGWEGECGTLPSVAKNEKGEYVASEKIHLNFKKQNN